ncbi:MAG: type II toxin-antitoxin system RelE/ParE family toxin [Magnetococcus sp. DMHC-8]
MDTGIAADMIDSFAHKGLQDLFETGNKSGVTPHLAQKLLDILDLLEAADNIEDMGSRPGADLHPWKGVKNVWSVRVTGNWRMVFKFQNGIAHDVDLVDPH